MRSNIVYPTALSKGFGSFQHHCIFQVSLRRLGIEHLPKGKFDCIGRLRRIAFIEDTLLVRVSVRAKLGVV